MQVDLTGQQLGVYRLTRLLGMGGMASVYAARQESVGREVAIKILPAHLMAQSPDYLERFKREVKVAASLEHPHILPVYDYGVHNNISFVVMRLMAGGMLSARLQAGLLPFPSVLKILKQTGSALDFAHRRGIVHRDIKASNILFDEEDNAYLADFGIAKVLLDASKGLTGTGMVLGTPAYMAPEQWQAAQIDGRTDIYAFGILTYQLLTGQMPFDAPTPYALMHKHLHETPASPALYNSDLPVELNRVVEKAMAKNPRYRYDKMADFLEDIDLVMAGRPQKARPVTEPTMPVHLESQVGTQPGVTRPNTVRENTTHSTPYPSRPQSSRNMTAFALLGMGALLLLVTIIGFLATNDNSDISSPERGVIVQPTEIPATATQIPATATEIPATATQIPATATQIPATATEIPATATQIPATATEIPATATQAPPEVSVLSGVSRNADWRVLSQDFDGAEMVFVPEGCFMMGSANGDYDESPLNQQCMEAFWMDRYEVTNAQFSRLGGRASQSSKWTDPQTPRETINWNEAKAFCEQRGGRLPTEAEFEYAARGPDNLTYPWGHQFVARNVVHGDNSGGRTQTVGLYPSGASWVGAYDLSGNVWEWLNTRYYSYPYNINDGREEPRGADPVVRGGSWTSAEHKLRMTFREVAAVNYADEYIGFRCVRDVGQNAPSANPAVPTSARVICEGLLLPRLELGGRAYVIPNQGGNFLNTQPARPSRNPSSQRILIIPEGGILTILEGPECDYQSDIVWWRVDYNGSIGWTGESDARSYWMEPLD